VERTTEEKGAMVYTSQKRKLKEKPTYDTALYRCDPAILLLSYAQNLGRKITGFRGKNREC
jgi:hypothetical protein